MTPKPYVTKWFGHEAATERGMAQNLLFLHMMSPYHFPTSPEFGRHTLRLFSSLTLSPISAL